MSRKEFRELAPPEEAREVIDALDLRPDDETVPLREARGRVLAERVDAALDVPGFDRASVDGYAVRAADTFGADEADPDASNWLERSTPAPNPTSRRATASASRCRRAPSCRRVPTRW